MNQLLEYVALGWIDAELAKMPPEQRAAIRTLWGTDFNAGELMANDGACDICHIGGHYHYQFRYGTGYDGLYLCNKCLTLIHCDLDEIVEQLEQEYPGLTEALESVIEPQPVLNLCPEFDDTILAEWDVNGDAHILDDITIVENIVDYYKSHPTQWTVLRNQATVRSKQLRPALQLPPQMDDVDLHCISRPLNKYLLEIGYVRKYEAHPSGDGRMVELLVKGE